MSVEEEKFVLYIGGGVMAGVFSAGVVSAFEEKDLYGKIKAVYTSSCGAFVASYFLSNQTKVGSSIFYDDLVQDFIKPKLIPVGTYDRFYNKFIKKIPREKIRNAIDIGYLMRLAKEKKILNTKAIRERQIPCYVHALNTDTMQAEFLNLTESEDVFKLLEMSVSAVPYYFPESKYIDGEIIDPFPIEEIIERHPNDKIIAILNILPRKFIRRLLKGTLEGFVATLMYSAKIWKIYISRDLRTIKKLKIMQENENIIVIAPDNKLKLWPNTLGRAKLIQAYEEGKKAGYKLADQLK